MEKKSDYKKGLWTVEEDRILMDYIGIHGNGKWNRIPKVTGYQITKLSWHGSCSCLPKTAFSSHSGAGLKRCGKSCRLRWINYLSPGVKRGDFSEEENDLIIRLHNLLGNRWSLIAGRVPGRTDNQVKNHWNTHLSKKLGIKKEKNKVSVSAQNLSKKLKQNCSTSSCPNSTPSRNCDDIRGANEKVITGEGKSDNADDSNGTQGLITMNDDYENSSWFFHDELNLQTPTVMELLDEPLDFVWHGL